jgi:hypothetical protein
MNRSLRIMRRESKSSRIITIMERKGSLGSSEALK